MSYVQQHKARVKEMKANLSSQRGMPHYAALIDQIDAYDREFRAYAEEADAFDPSKDDIQLFLVSFTLHKRQDATGKTELYYATVVGDNGKHEHEPVVTILDHYHQMKKDETWKLRNPVLIYEGNPKGEVSYYVSCFDTQRDNHDSSVKAFSSIVSAATTAVAGLVGGPAGVAVGAAVASVNSALTSAAVNHNDELFDNFPGSLTENDPFDRGPYSLALPNIKLASDRITVHLHVARDADARSASRTIRGVQEGVRRYTSPRPVSQMGAVRPVSP